MKEPVMNFFTRICIIFCSVCFSEHTVNAFGLDGLTNPPVAVNDETYNVEGVLQTGDVSLNDFDPNGDELTYSIAVYPIHGELTLNPDGTFSYLPEAQYAGFDYATYEVCDPGGLCDQATIEFAMTFVNDVPQANNDNFTAFSGIPFYGNISLNDVELDDEVNWWYILSPPANADFFSLNINGSFVYVPEAGFEGTDMFVYQTCDPCAACDFAFAYIEVIAPVDPPAAVDDFTFIPEDMILNWDVSLNDTQTQGEELTFSIENMPTFGSLTMNANGSFTYIPQLNYYGLDSFSYNACDIYNQCSQATVTIEVTFVNDSPIANDDYLTIDEDTQGSMAVGANDIEYDVELLTYVLAYGPYHGTTTWDEPSGQFVYTPFENYFGLDTLGYLALDPCGAMNFAEVIITILPVNDTPVAEGDDYEISEDEVLTDDVSENDYDLDDTVLTYSLSSTPVLGTIDWNGDGGFVYTPFLNVFGTEELTYTVSDPAGATAQAILTIEIETITDAPMAENDEYEINEDSSLNGTVASNDFDSDNSPLSFSFESGSYNGTFVGNTDGTFSYTPSEDFFGEIEIEYFVCDNTGLCDDGLLTILVLSVNDSPVAGNDNFFVAEELTLNSNVSDNDSDPESAILFYSIVEGPQFGTLSMFMNGDFSYTPVDDWNGFEYIIYEVCDGGGACVTANLTIEVLFVNDFPQPQNDVYTMLEDTFLSGDVSLNDIEPEDEIMFFVPLSNPTQGVFVFNENGSFTFQPNQNYNGTLVVNYLACDPCGACALVTLTINVTAVNDLPIALNDSFSTNEENSVNATVAANDSDVDNGNSSLTYSLLGIAQNGSINFNNNGSFIYTPNLNFNGVESIEYQVCDPGQLCDIGLLSITVNPINDVPVALDDEFDGLEDIVITGDVSANDSDVDSPGLTYSVVSNPSYGNLNLLPNGSFTFQPTNNFYGEVTFTYSVCDNASLCDQASVSISILAANDTPVAVNDIFGVLINSSLSASIAINDYDVDNDLLTYSVVTDALNGNLTLNSNGSFIYTPDFLFVGSETITYSVCDLSLACDTGYLIIEMASNNESPDAVDDVFEINEDEPLVALVSGNDSDTDGYELDYELIVTPESGICVMSENGEFSFNPLLNFHGTIHFAYQVCDIFGACSIGEVTINVLPVNDAPVAINDANSLLEDVSEYGWVSFNDNDVDGDNLTYTLIEGPMNGNINWFGNGSYEYIPNENFFGSDQITYTVCDPFGLCDNAILSISVIFVNDIPEVVDETYFTDMDQTVEGSVAVNDVELDPEILLYSTLTEALNGVFILNEDGTFTYTPNDGFIGTETVYYEGCDPCGACDQGLLTIEILQVNTAPFAFDLTLNHCSLDPILVDISSIIGDLETSDNNLSISVGQVDLGEWFLEGSVLNYTPVYNQSGIVSIPYSVCDDSQLQLCASAQIHIELNSAYVPTVLSSNVVNVSCFGSSTGSAEVEVMDEGYPINFTWSNEENGSAINDLPAGEYNLTITPTGDCVLPTSETFFVLQPDAPIQIIGLTASNISDLPGGSSSYEISGGTAPYFYEWVDDSGNIVGDEMILGPFDNSTQAGSYTLTITDFLGCTISQEIVITDLFELDASSHFTLFPNPVTNELFINGNFIARGTLDCTITDAIGQVVIKKRFVGGGSNFNETIDFSPLASGMYHVSLSANDVHIVLPVVKQ